MSTITREQLHERAREKVKSLEFAVTQTAFADSRAELEEELELARIALASLEAEAVCVIDQSNLDYLKSGADADVWPASRTEMGDVLLYRAAPPAPVSVPDGYRLQPISEYDAMCAAMLQAEPVSNSDELPLDYLQGHKDGLEWAAQLAEANHPQTGDWLYDDQIALAAAIRKGPDMPELKSEFADEDDNFYSWFGRFWLENYQQNNHTTSAKQMLGTMAEFAWRAGRRAAMLQGVEQPQSAQQNIPEIIPATQFKPVADLYGLTSPTGGETSFTFDAVEARDFIDGGWSCQEYVELERFQEAVSGNSPVIQDGWVMVPVEPTEDMIVNGFESEPDESFSDEKEWEAYEAMSGCQQAAHRAKLCWAAMIAAAPKLE